MQNQQPQTKQEQPSQQPQILNQLSPQKFGQAAFVQLSYTPSKLVDNVLYRQANTLKKLEEGNGKLREIQAINFHLQDQLNQMKEEKEGIQQSLNSQIKMYKRFLQESEKKYDLRMKEMQNTFKQEMCVLIQEKQELAKYSQSEKQLLQNRISQLQSIISELKEKLSQKENEYDELKNNKEKLDIQYKNVCEKLSETQERMNKEKEEGKEEYEKLSRKLYNAEIDFKNEIEGKMKEKQKEIEDLERGHRNQLQRIEANRNGQNAMKNEEIKNLTSAFETEAKRLNELVNVKDKMIQEVNKDLSKEKNTILELTKGYENQISNLAHEKSKLLGEVSELSSENTKLNLKVKDSMVLLENEKSGYSILVKQLKDELELHKINYIREKDKNIYFTGDVEKELACLKAENSSLLTVVGENQILTKEVRSLRQLLLQSSHEMQKCKEQFLKMGREREILLLKIRQLGGECEVLNRIKQERQEEVRGWRDTYYLSRH